MTIDERLEKLSERHEALTQTVEMLALENRATEALMQKTEALIRSIAGGIHDLMQIARSHEQRISDLKGRERLLADLSVET